MIGIFESNSEVDDEDSEIDKKENLDANSSEIKNLLDKFKI